MKITATQYFELFNQIVEANKQEADFSDAVTDSLINKAEEALSLTFPPSYKWFLRKYGCGDILGCEFYGVMHHDFDNSGVPDAIWLTLKYRAKELPHSLILIYAFGTGEYAALELSRVDTEGESPVIACYTGFPIDMSKAEILADSFAEFLYKTMSSVLDRQNEAQ